MTISRSFPSWIASTCAALALSTTSAVADTDLEVIRVDPNAKPAPIPKEELNAAIAIRAKLDSFQSNGRLLMKDRVLFMKRKAEVDQLADFAEKHIPTWGRMRPCRLAAFWYKSYWSMIPNHEDAMQFGESFSDCKHALR